MLENYHVAEAFRLAHSEEQFNIFKLLDKDDYQRMRKRLIHCVLATDMTLHTEQYAFIKLKIENLEIESGKNVDKLFKSNDTPTSVFNTQKEFMNVLLHASDISNPAKPRKLSQKWLDMLCDEFMSQGDREKALNLPVSFMCDRNNINLPKTQVGFIGGIIIPMFSIIKEFFPELGFYLNNAKDNLNHFTKLKEEEEQSKE